MIRIRLSDIPPRLNNTYAVGRGNFYKKAAAKKEIEALQWEMKSQYRDKPGKGPVSLNVTFTFPDNVRRDIDGPVKSLLDAGTGILWVDDSQVIELHLFKRVVPKLRQTDLVLEFGDAPAK